MRAPFPAVGAARPLLPPAGCPLRAAQSPTLRPWGSGTSMETPGITHPQSWASVPKFDKVPWPGEASLRNKPLVLSLPKRSPHSYAIFPTSSKDMNLSILFHVPDVFSKVRKNQNNSMLLPNKPLCSTCQEISMIQSRPLRIPDGLKLSFKNFVSHRTMSLPQPQTQTFPKPSRDDIPTESIHYKLPILGPRTAVFHGLLSDAYKSLQEMEQTSLLRKEPTGKTVRTRCLGSERPHHASL